LNDYEKFLKQLQKFIKENPDISNKTEIAKELGTTRHSVRRGLKKLNIVLEKSEDFSTQESIKLELKPGYATLVTVSKRIKTIEDALDKADIDLDVWEVDRVIINSWEVGSRGPFRAYVRIDPLWQVKVWLKKKTINVVEFAEDFIARVKKHSPKYTIGAKYKRTCNKNAAEINIPDLHLGKLCWGDETGTDYDYKIGRKVYLYCVNEAIKRIEYYKPELVIFPIGNDFLHADNLQGTTTKGTQLDVDSRQTKIFGEALKLLVEAVDNILHYYPSVKIPVIPGNHDKLSMFHLGVALEAWYRNNKNVIIDNTPKRKYIKYGTNLIGFSHGGRDDPKIVDLPLIMAQERPQEWADSTNREWHIGHLHKKKETKYVAGDTFKGVSVRIIPSISGTDAWHVENGFIKAIHSSEVFVWNYEEGLLSEHTIKVPMKFYKCDHDY